MATDTARLSSRPNQAAYTLNRAAVVLATLLAVVVSIVLPHPAEAGPTDVVYAAGFGVRDLYRVNLANGTVTTVYSNYPIAPAAQNVAALAQRSSDGMIFYIAGTSGNGAVYRWNPATPATAPVLVGQTGAGTPYMPRLAFSAGGTLYALDTGGTQLYTINQSTGAATATGGPLFGGPSGGGDMAFSPSGTLYLVNGANLYTVPLTGGVVTDLGPMSGFAGTAVGAAFEPLSGELLVANSATPAKLYSVNLATRAATPFSGTMTTNQGDLASVARREADLSVMKTDSQATEIPGTTVTYTITVTNDGPSDASGATLTDTLPASVTGVTWTCAITAGTGSCGDASGSGNAISTTVNLASGAVATYTVTGTIDPAATGTLSNTAMVAPPSAVTDPTPANDSATDSDTLEPSTDLSIVKSDSPDPARVGQTLDYTLTVTNLGPSRATGVSVSDPLPSQVVFVSSAASQGSCSGSATVTCSLGALSPGASATVTIVVRPTAAARAATPISNTATVSASTSDGTSGNNSDTEQTVIENTPVLAGDDSDATAEDTPVGTSVLANDTDVDGDALSVSAFDSTGANGGNVACTSGGICTYTPPANFFGTDTYSYTVSDGNGGTDTATVTITVSAVNDAPVAADDADSTSEETPITLAVRGNDSPGPGNESAQSLTLTPGSLSDPPNGAATINGDGTVTYAPDPDFFGADSFTYEVCDSGSPSLCDTATVTATVTPVNDPPTAADDTLSTAEDTPVTLDPRANDASGPPNESAQTLAITPGSLSSPSDGSVVLNADGTVTYSPNADFFGPDTFTYEVCDSGSPSLCDSATVTITVSAVNDAPAANDDARSTAPDTPVTFDVRANDAPGPWNESGQTLAVTPGSLTDPPNGSVALNADGTVTYTPDAGFTGTDAFAYEVCDSGSPSLCDSATVTITVAPVNRPPVALDDARTTPEDGSVTLDVRSNDSPGPPAETGQTLAVTPGSLSSPANGTVGLNPDGTVTYIPDPDFFGADSFTYEVCDSGSPSLCDSATVTITVSAVNDAPAANDDARSTAPDTPVTFDVRANDAPGPWNESGQTLAVTPGSLTDPPNGSVALNADGTVTYTPDAGFTGTDAFAYEVCDSGTPAACDNANVAVTVAGNSAPTAVPDTAGTNGGAPVTILVLANDFDPDADPLAITTASSPANGTVSCDASSCTYTPSSGFTGIDTFTYTISDGRGGTSTAAVTVTVAPPSSPPPPPTPQPPAPPASVRQTSLTIVSRPAVRVVRSGETVGVRTTVRNVGAVRAINLVVCQHPTRRAVFVSAPRARLKRGRACWRVASLAPGSSVTFTMRLRVDRTAKPGQLGSPASARANNARGVVRAVANVRVVRAAPASQVEVAGRRASP